MDRNTVTSTLGDATVTIGGRFTAPAKVVFIHPLHNFALVQFDPKTVPDSIEVGQARRDLPLRSVLEICPRCTRRASGADLVAADADRSECFDHRAQVRAKRRLRHIAKGGHLRILSPLARGPSLAQLTFRSLGRPDRSQDARRELWLDEAADAESAAVSAPQRRDPWPRDGAESRRRRAGER